MAKGTRKDPKKNGRGNAAGGRIAGTGKLVGSGGAAGAVVPGSKPPRPVFPLRLRSTLALRLRSAAIAPLLTKTVDPSRLKASRAKAKAYITGIKEQRIAKRDAKNIALHKQFEKARQAKSASIKHALDSRAKRTPDQVISSFVKRVNNLPRGSKKFAGMARLIVRSTQTDVVSFRKLLATALAVDLDKAGIAVERMPLSKRALNSYVVGFSVEHRSVRTELMNLAWALRRKGVFHSVAVSGLQGNLFAPTAATHAERNFAWNMDLTRTTRAHELPPMGTGRALGEGIVIAHIDTGWAEHAQYNRAGIDVANSHNVITGNTGGNAACHSILNRDAESPNITHGVATGSVILGGRVNDGEELTSTRSDDALEFSTMPDGSRQHIGGRNVRDASGHLTGAAPLATVLPIKFISDAAAAEIPSRGFSGVGVFRLFDNDLVNAVRYAIDANAHVISFSVGGLMHDEVRQILDEAILEHDMIVAAAVGQTYLGNAVSVVGEGLSWFGLVADDSVVLPAAYTNVIAVAGCGPSGQPWSESHRGPNVDITAPADAVWIADYQPKDDRSADATRGETLECASGTSFAAPLVASAAALWLAHHGRQALRARYRPAGVPLAWVFRHQLQRTARVMSDWDDGRYGPGVLDSEALLREPLPRPEDVEPPPAMVTGLVPGVSAGLEAAHDAWLEFSNWAGEQWDNGVRQAAIWFVAGQQAVDQGLDALGDAWAQLDAAAQDATADALREIDRAKAEIEQGITDLAEQAADAIEDAGEAAEDVMEEVGEAAEEFVDNVGEAGEDVAEWVDSWMPW
jgi:subtilisin family serine protease